MCLQIDSEEQAVHEQRSGAEKRLQEIQGIKDAHAKERRKAKAKLTTLEAQIAKCAALPLWRAAQAHA